MQFADPYIELCFGGSSSIFKGLPQNDKELLNNKHSVLVVKKGKFIFKEGVKSKGLICLASGKMKVYREGAGGRGQVIKMVRPQGFVGYRNLFSDNPWPFSGLAIEETAVCIFEKNPFCQVLKANPDFCIRFMKLIIDELSFANSRIISLTQKHIRARLAESIIILRDTYGYEADGKTIRASVSREDIANLSNMTTSNAIRTLSNLASEGIVEVNGRKISIVDNKYLAHISDAG